MKVLDLRCAHDHRFEGWFGSEDDFTTQHSRGLVECPMCGDRTIDRLPSAPRLNVANLREAPVVPAAAAPMGPEQRQALWLQAVRHVLRNTEDVGERFAHEARRMHAGEIEHRGIRGQATREEAEALRDEGIEVLALPIPESMKGPVQ